MLLVTVSLVPISRADGLGLFDDVLDLSALTPLLEIISEDSFTDASFGTLVRRLSHAIVTQDNADPTNGVVEFISQEYATISPFNADNSLLLLLHFSYFALYTGNGDYIRDLPFEVHASSAPRWSRHEPGVFYFLSNNRLKRFDVDAWESTVVREFSEYSQVTSLGESDLSYDGDHLVLVGDDREIFVYTLSTDTKSRSLAADVARDIDNIQITPDNHVIVGWYARGTGRQRGYELFDPVTGFIRQLTTVLGHMDVTRDEDGREIMLWHNAAEPNPLPGCDNAVVKVDLATGNRTCLVTFPWGLGVHISAADSGGWFVASTYTAELYASGSSELQVVRVSLDGTKIQRLVQHGSEPFDSYRFQPKAATSRDGSRVVYSSNYGLQDSLDYPAGYTDAYLISDFSAAPVSAIELPTADPEDEGGGDDPGTGDTGTGDTGTGDTGTGDTGADTGGTGGTVTTPTGSGTQGSGPGTGGGVSLPPAPVVMSCREYFRNLDEDHIVRVEENDSSVSTLGKWHEFSHDKLSGRRILASNKAGASITFEFPGTTVAWVGYVGPWGSAADIYIDGVLLTTVDTRHSDHVIRERIFVARNLDPGYHNLRVEVAEQEGLDSSGIWIDAFEYIDSASPLFNCYPDAPPEGLVSPLIAGPGPAG